jgi:hypothetical protein
MSTRECPPRVTASGVHDSVAGVEEVQRLRCGDWDDSDRSDCRLTGCGASYAARSSSKFKLRLHTGDHVQSTTVLPELVMAYRLYDEIKWGPFVTIQTSCCLYSYIAILSNPIFLAQPPNPLLSLIQRPNDFVRQRALLKIHKIALQTRHTTCTNKDCVAFLPASGLRRANPYFSMTRPNSSITAKYSRSHSSLF